MEQAEKHCHYSGLPSPMAYMDDDVDYDGMGNYGRFPKPKDKNNMKIKRILQKIYLWFSLIKKKSKRKSIWDL